MVHSGDADGEHILELLALHKYFLNSDLLRDVFMGRIKRDLSPAATDPVSSMDDMIAMSHKILPH